MQVVVNEIGGTDNKTVRKYLCNVIFFIKYIYKFRIRGMV